MTPKLNVSRRTFLAGSAVAAGVGFGLPAMAASQAAGATKAPAYGPLPGVAKLNANENPYGPSPAAKKP